jgi:CheY-like chemotaxis protein
MTKASILWVDDEIDLLKPHILFLEQRGYDITPVSNGADAIEKCEKEVFDIVFLDENMPGMTGLETLAQIKQLRPTMPAVMITKSEEEHIMEDAIGSDIADYLIKPLNPNQILLSVKKILDKQRLFSEKTNMSYQQDFRNLAMAFNDNMDHAEWADIYKKLVFWELEIERTENKSMEDVIIMQKDEANTNFARFIEDNYEDWLNDPKVDRPILSHQLMKKKVFPHIKQDDSLFFILIDNLRLDQWRIIQPLLETYFTVEEESTYYSILPTATAFARNAIFSGMMPSDMQKYHPEIWVGDDEDEGKNKHEEEFLAKQLSKNGLSNIKFSYHKILNTQQGKDVADKINNLMGNQLNAIVYNFVDMMSHARTDTQMIRELAPDEAAYRSLTYSWFQHSPLLEIIKKIADKKKRIIITTDHGTIRVKKPFKIVGDKSVNSNLRYKQGKNLGFDNSNNVMVVRKPESIFLPKINVSTAYVFANNDAFFAYPNNYNYYVNYFKDTFQHGGISLEEMVIPIINLTPKSL